MNEEIQVAQTAPAPGPGGPFGDFSIFLLFGALFLVMWALMIRPQQKERKRVQAMQQALKKGDAVVTNGMHGRVTGVQDDMLTVEIAANVRVKFDRSAVSRLAQAAPEKQAPKSRGRKEKSA